jgi:uncharacterized protein
VRSARRGAGLLLLAAVWLVTLFGGLASAQPSYPALTGRVVDAANLLPPSTEGVLTSRLAALETATGRQLVVATVPSLGGYEIEEYGYRLAAPGAWAARRPTTARSCWSPPTSGACGSRSATAWRAS